MEGDGSNLTLFGGTEGGASDPPLLGGGMEGGRRNPALLGGTEGGASDPSVLGGAEGGEDSSASGSDSVNVVSVPKELTRACCTFATSLDSTRREICAVTSMLCTPGPLLSWA